MNQNAVILAIPENTPDSFLNSLQDELPSIIKIEAFRQKPTPYNALDWVIPTAIICFITRKFFDGFFKEAGKDTYSSFKNWVKKNSALSRTIEVKTITSHGYNSKRTTDTQSKAFSIFF